MRTVATRAIATAVVFFAALVLGIDLHLDLPPARRAVATRVNALLEPIFAGKLTIERIGGLGLTHADDVDARVDGPDGKLVISATGVTARVSTAKLLRSLRSGDIVVDVHDVSIARSEVNLDSDPAGTLRIVDAFAPRSPSAPGPPGPGVRVTLSHVHVEHASVHGRIQGLPSLDADADSADASVSVSVSPVKIAVDVTRTRILARDLPGALDARGTAEVHLALPSPTGRNIGLTVAYLGTVGSIPVTGRFAFDDGAIDAVVDTPPVPPEEMRSLWAGWPLLVATSAHAEAHGSLPQLNVQVRASAGSTTLDAAGPLIVAPRLQGSLHVDAKGLDARALALSAPISDIAASGDVSFAEKPTGAIDVRAAMDLPAGLVGRVRTPSMAVTAEVTSAPASRGGITARVKAAVHQAGAPTMITARLAPKGESFAVSFIADANVPELGDVLPLGGVAHGRAMLHAEGNLDLASDAIDARVSAAAENLDIRGELQAQAANVEVHVTGHPNHPAFDVQVTGEGVEAAGMSLASITGQTRVEVDGGPTLRDVDVEARAGAHDVRMRAKLLRIVGDEVRVEDAMIHGFGAPIEATVRIAPGQLHVRARSDDVDLARVARFTQVSVVRDGRVSLDVDATVGAGVAEGRVAIDVSHAAFASFQNASAHVQATLHGREAAGTVIASVPEIGSIEVQSSSIQVGAAGPLSMSSWRRAWGALDIKAIVELPKLAARLPPGTLPFRPLGGELQFAGRVERDSMSDSTPAVDCTASTTGLVLAGGSGAAAWYLDGFNPTVHVGVDGQTGDTSVGIRVRDNAGIYFEADATSSAVPYASIFNNEETIESLRTMPFDATVRVPSRSLQSLPVAWGLGGVPGQLQAELTWHGAANSPAVRVSGSLKRVRADLAASALPVDLAFAADYDGARASATLRATNKGKVVLDASAGAELRAADLFGGLAGAAVAWKGSARAKLDALPLRSIAFLSDRQVRGRVSGELTLDGLHEDARASATATIDGLAIGDVACRSARFQAVLDGQALDASARVEHEGGFVDARVHTGMKWGRALAPEIDPALPADAALSAKQFRAALLLPFVSGLFAGLDGLIDADARVAIDPGTRVARPEGTIKLTKGEFELTSLGGEFTDTSATVTLTPDGLIRVEDAVAHGISGRIEAAASARMVGFAFSGARATVQVPKTEPIPVVFDGVEVGKMEGRFDIEAIRAPDHKELDVKVNVPRLHMELPLSAAHDVQALGGLEGVTTGVVRGSDDFVEIPLDAAVSAPSGGPAPSPIKIAVRLGGDVEVTRGEDLDVRLEGQPIITIANDVTVTGQIRLQRGTLDIYGKPFEVEKGTVSFIGPDPGNPQVVLTAGWTAQDGTHVYADFVGPLKTGKVTLRSEPVSSQNEILALILSGTADTSAGATSQQAQMSTVAGAAGGAATQPINRALGGVNRALENLGLAGGISTKIDTSQTNPRPEVELQIARDISLQIAWVLGTPVPGSNPDTTLVTLNWSFLRKWSLETTVGDAGTSILDLIWQHRY